MLPRGILANCFLMLCVFSVALPAAILPFREPMLRLFGASDATYSYAAGLFHPLPAGYALCAAGLRPEPVHRMPGLCSRRHEIRGAGGARTSCWTLCSSSLSASACAARPSPRCFPSSQAAFMRCAFCWGKKPPIRITRGGYSAAVMRRVLTLGFSPFIIIALDNVMIIAMNAVLQHYGGAARGDVGDLRHHRPKLHAVVTMPLEASRGGTQSILSYNYGAYRTERVHRQGAEVHFRAGAGVHGCDDSGRAAGRAVVRAAVHHRRSAGGPGVRHHQGMHAGAASPGPAIRGSDGFTALGLAKLALPLSLWRKAVYFAAVFALPAFFGADAVFYAEPISDVLGPLASVAVYCVCIRGVLARRAALAPQKLPN